MYCAKFDEDRFAGMSGNLESFLSHEKLTVSEDGCQVILIKLKS